MEDFIDHEWSRETVLWIRKSFFFLIYSVEHGELAPRIAKVQTAPKEKVMKKHKEEFGSEITSEEESEEYVDDGAPSKKRKMNAVWDYYQKEENGRWKATDKFKKETSFIHLFLEQSKDSSWKEKSREP